MVLVFTPFHSRVLFLLLNVHPPILLQLLVSFKDVKICRVLEMGALHFFHPKLLILNAYPRLSETVCHSGYAIS